jgi:hypothetical protein
VFLESTVDAIALELKNSEYETRGKEEEEITK